MKKDSKLKSLEIAIEQKKEECSKLETQLQKVGLCPIEQNQPCQFREKGDFGFDLMVQFSPSGVNLKYTSDKQMTHNSYVVHLSYLSITLEHIL